MPTKKTTKPINREQWLEEAARLLVPQVQDATEAQVGPFAVTCGWPSKNATGRRLRRIGECWYPAGERETSELFISPALPNEIEVLATLAHELVHVAMGYEAGHGRAFAAACNQLGLVGKATATEPSQEFEDEVARPIIEALGSFPHQTILLDAGGSSWRKPPKGEKPKDEKPTSGSTLAVDCPECGYKARVSRKWLEVAPLQCPVHKVDMVVPEG